MDENYISESCSPLDDNVPAMPVRVALASCVEFSAAVHARSRLLWKWRQNYGRLVRDREGCPDSCYFEKRSIHKKRAKKAKNRLGIQRKSRKGIP
uniref:Uncharacterized protein n=1 Tax=Peronospora matthiolae TaxID=2874970 RepID=A0AAV1UI30_9STRA